MLGLWLKALLDACWGLNGKPLGSLAEAILKHLGRPLAASWGRVGASWGPACGLGGPLGAESSKSQFEFPLLGLSLCSLGALFGRLGRLLGRPEARVSRLGTLWGASCGDRGASWAVRDTAKIQKPNMIKMYVFQKGWDGFCPFGVLLGRSWGSLEVSWGPLVPLWAGHGGLGGLLASLRACLLPSSPTSTLKFPLPETENGPRTAGAKFGTGGEGGVWEKRAAPGPGAPDARYIICKSGSGFRCFFCLGALIFLVFVVFFDCFCWFLAPRAQLGRLPRGRGGGGGAGEERAPKTNKYREINNNKTKTKKTKATTQNKSTKPRP